MENKNVRNKNKYVRTKEKRGVTWTYFVSVFLDK